MTHKKIRKLIRKILLENNGYEELKARSREKAKAIHAGKDFAKIVIDQLETAVSGIDANLDPLEIKNTFFLHATYDINKHYDKIKKEYKEKISDPQLVRAAEEAGQRKTAKTYKPIDKSRRRKIDKAYEDIW